MCCISVFQFPNFAKPRTREQLTWMFFGIFVSCVINCYFAAKAPFVEVDPVVRFEFMLLHASIIVFLIVAGGYVGKLLSQENTDQQSDTPETDDKHENMTSVGRVR